MLYILYIAYMLHKEHIIVIICIQNGIGNVFVISTKLVDVDFTVISRYLLNSLQPRCGHLTINRHGQ